MSHTSVSTAAAPRTKAKATAPAVPADGSIPIRSNPANPLKSDQRTIRTQMTIAVTIAPRLPLLTNGASNTSRIATINTRAAITVNAMRRICSSDGPPGDVCGSRPPSCARNWSNEAVHAPILTHNPQASPTPPSTKSMTPARRAGASKSAPALYGAYPSGPCGGWNGGGYWLTNPHPVKDRRDGRRSVVRRQAGPDPRARARPSEVGSPVWE